MRVRSLSQLAQLLEDELAWRKRELTTLKFTLERCRPHEKAMLVRAAFCVLYAHWEGFVKAAATGYLSFVALRGLRYRDLTPNFVALGLRSDIMVAGRSNKPTLHTALAEKLLTNPSGRARFDWENAVDTHANLNSETLLEILCLLGLDERDYVLKRQILDHRLLANRNLIAHGKRVEVVADDYFGLHEEIINLVERFRNDVENAAVLQRFERVAS